MSRRIPSLDGLRAISIIIVIASHSLGADHQHPLWLRLLFEHGNLGVRIFFVISGYLITGLLLREREASGTIAVGRFYARRALRLLPAFYVFIAVVAILNWRGIIAVPADSFLYALTYTMNFAPHGSWWTGHLWSLSVEEQFYFIWPLAIAHFKTQTCAAVAAIAIFAGILIRGIFTITGLSLLDPAYRYAFPYVCGAIATGCLLAIYEPAVRVVLDRWLPGARALLLVPVILAADSTTLPFNRLLTILVDILLAILVERSVRTPGGFLNCGPMRFLGVLSYSLYLWQQLFSPPYVSWRIVPFPFSILVLAAAATISYFGIERPFIGMRRRLRSQVGANGKQDDPALLVRKDL